MCSEDGTELLKGSTAARAHYFASTAQHSKYGRSTPLLLYSRKRDETMPTDGWLIRVRDRVGSIQFVHSSDPKPTVWSSGGPLSPFKFQFALRTAVLVALLRPQIQQYCFPLVNPWRDCRPVLGTNYSNPQVVCPQNGTAGVKGLSPKILRP